jgi:hypothetical protein
MYLISSRLISPSTRAVMCDFRSALSRRARSHHASQSCSRGPITLASRAHLPETRRSQAWLWIDGRVPLRLDPAERRIQESSTSPRHALI